MRTYTDRYGITPYTFYIYSFIYKRKYIILDTKRDVDHKTLIATHKLMQKIKKKLKL